MRLGRLKATTYLGRFGLWHLLLHMLLFPNPVKRANLPNGSWFEVKGATLGDVARLLPCAVEHTLMGTTLLQVVDFQNGESPNTSPNLPQTLR